MGSFSETYKESLKKIYLSGQPPRIGHYREYSPPGGRTPSSRSVPTSGSFLAEGNKINLDK